MEKYSKMLSAYTRIWFFASLMNAILGSLFIMANSWSIAGMLGSILLVFILSLVFAGPGILIAMLITAIVLSYKTNLSLFGVIMTISLFTFSCTAIFFMNLLGKIDKDSIYLCISVVISAIIAVFICRNYLLENDNCLDASKPSDT